jgi:hypothetical protein
MERIIHKESNNNPLYSVFAIILTILIMQVLLPQLSIQAFADPVSAEYTSGDEIEITISLPAAQVSAPVLYLLYDTDAFAYVADSVHTIGATAANGRTATLDREFLTGDELAAMSSWDRIVKGSRFKLSAKGDETGEIVALTLQVKDAAAIGDYAIELYATWGLGKTGMTWGAGTDGLLVTPSAVKVVSESTGGTGGGTIIPGDFDGSGSVTISDVIQISKYITRVETPNDLQKTIGDLDGDEEITAVDGVMLAQLVAA